MKRLLVALIICAMALGASASAANWAEGRSPAQPYSNVPQVDLNDIMGYYVKFPSPKLKASRFCDKLQIYLPREDVMLSTGKLHLFAGQPGREATEVETVDFSNSSAVTVRKLTDEELKNLMWGGGVSVQVQLRQSLAMDMNYYVLMDGNCFTAANGKVANADISKPTDWTPVLEGDYGVCNLRYTATPAGAAAVAPDAAVEAPAVDMSGLDMFGQSADAPEQEADDGTLGGFGSAMSGGFADTVIVDGYGTPKGGDLGEEAEAAPAAPAAVASSTEPKLVPEVGDTITFDLKLGGIAASMVIYSENNSVLFDQPQYTVSGTVTGRVVDANVNWGVIFLDAHGTAVDGLNLTR